MGVLTWFNQRVENNAPTVAGALAYGGTYLNPLASKQDARRAQALARGITQAGLQQTAPLRQGVAGLGDHLAAQGARETVKMADQLSGGLVAGPAQRAQADINALYDKASTLVPVLTVKNEERSYTRDLLDGNAKFSRSNLHSSPIQAQEYHTRLTRLGLNPGQLPQMQKLTEALAGQGEFLEREGYASLLKIAEERGPEGAERLTEKLNRYLQDGKKPEDFRRKVAACGLRDIAFPTTIDQGGKANCGAIAVQQMWARQRPESYLEALTSLAEGHGHRFSNGQVLSPLNDATKDAGDDRDLSVKVMGDALSRHAHERSLVRQAGLDIARDGASRLGLSLGPTPMDNYHPETQPMGIHAPYELATLLEDISGHKYAWRHVHPLTQGLGQVDQGKPVATLISGRADKEWHWIQLTGRAGQDVKVSSWGNEYQVHPDRLSAFTRSVLIDMGPK